MCLHQNRGLARLRMDSEVSGTSTSINTEAAAQSQSASLRDTDLSLSDAKKPKKILASESKVAVIGLSHNTATVEVREKLAVAEYDWQQVGRELASLPSISEAAVLSTCNRFEIYISTNDIHRGTREVYEYLNRRSSLPVKELRNHLFTLQENDAAWHGLRVAGGLDSLVIGEGQILSQMKRCYELATSKEGAAGKVLSRFLNAAVSAGKRVRAETGISRGGVSISSAAVELVEKKCVADLGLEISQLDICILGAGKMGRLLVQHLTPRGVKSIHLINRSQERAKELAELFPDVNIVCHTTDEMLTQVAKCHVTFACTSAREPILTKLNLEHVLEKKVMLVDISVPRNIEDKELNTLDNCRAYNVDDLKAVVSANQAKRRKLILEAEEVLEEELKAFGNWHQSLGTIPTISKLQGRAEILRQAEIHKMHNKLSGLTPAEREVVERLTKGIVAKLIHGPMAHLRTVDNVEDRTNSVKSLERMFNL
jgi:glutamyl-tRNA reductase